MNRMILPALALTAVTLLGGCSSTIDSRDLRADWTPELQSLTKSEDSFKNMTSRHRHNTWRQIHDDWAMIWLVDRNLRLNKHTLP